MSMQGGEPWAITDIPRGAGNPEWAPDGKTIAFSSTARPADLTAAAKPAGDKPSGDKPRESDVRVITEAVYRANGVAGDGFVDRDRPSHIWTIAVPATASEKTTPDAADVRRVRREPTIAGPPTARASSSSRTGGESPTTSPTTATCIRSRKRAASRPACASIDGRIGAYALSPDGKRVAFVGILHGSPERSYSQPDLWVAELGGRHAAQPDRRLRLRHERRDRRRSARAARAASERSGLEPRRPLDPHRRRRAGQRQHQACGCRDGQDRSADERAPAT